MAGRKEEQHNHTKRDAYNVEKNLEGDWLKRYDGGAKQLSRQEVKLMKIRNRSSLKTARWLALAFLVTVLLTPCWPQAPQKTAPPAPKPIKNLEEKLKKFRLFMGTEMKRWEVPGIGVGIYKDGKVLLSEGFGYRDREKKLPVTPNTLFAIGSASKAFTTMDVQMLVEDGKVEWDKPVQTYLPDFQLKDEVATARMTVRDLVCHRSGLPRHDGLWYGTTLTRKEIYDRLRYLDFSADFRSTFQYNNLMFLTAGYMVGQLSNSSWEEFTRRRIFEPLGMTSSNFSVDDSQKTADYSLPYQKEEGKVVPIPFRKIENIGPAGSINSNVNDMLKWVEFHLNKGKVGEKQVVSEAGQKEVTTPAMFMRQPMLSLQPDNQSIMSYGLGWFIETYRGHLVVHHGGAIDGFFFLNAFLPNDNVGAVVLTNLGGTPLLYLSMGYILDMVLGLEPVWEKKSLERFAESQKEEAQAKDREKEEEAERVKDTKPSHPLEAYVGEYEHPAYGVIAVELKDNALQGKHFGFEFKLDHWHYDVFKPSDHLTKVTFLTNLKGDIDRLSVSMEPAAAPIEFTRKASAAMKDPKFLAQFQGTYEIRDTTLTVTLKGDALFVERSGQAAVELVPYKGTEFTIKGREGSSVKFVLENGVVTEIVMGSRFGSVRGKKIK
jgi:CubicO group peptidase (beta-lactamase class C family)